MTLDFVTIERVGERWDAIIWGGRLTKLAAASGASPEAALQNARGVLKRQSQERSKPRRTHESP